jgi:glycosyltransferase involved in cell wall biosynthesis
LKILFPFVGDSVGGSHRSILELYYMLESNSITPIFVIHRMGPLSELFDAINIQYEYIPVKYLAGESPSLLKIIFGIIFNYLKLIKFINKNKIDIVHGNDLRINLTWSLPTKLSRSAYLWHQRSFMSSSIFWKSSVLLADHFVSISKYVDQSLPNNIPRLKKTLILNPFDVKNIYDKNESRRWLNKLYSISKKTILLGYIGRLLDWKNIDFLLRGFAKYAKNSVLQVNLIIVGTGDNEYIDILKQLACQLGVEDIVIFAGFNAKPNKVISAFDVIIAPSNREPFGRTLVEAMIQFTPVLAARGGGHSEIINDGITGRLYSHNNIGNFMSQLDKYMNSRSAHKITNKANTIASLKYSSQQHFENIVQIYKQLVCSHSQK